MQQAMVQNFINGQFVDSSTSKWVPLLNPATQEVIGEARAHAPSGGLGLVAMPRRLLLPSVAAQSCLCSI
jgi:hypothetical protein